MTTTSLRGDAFSLFAIGADPIGEADEHGRHLFLGQLCDHFHNMILAKDARRLLEDPAEIPERAGLWLAPSWVWLRSRISVGRKDLAADGSRLLLPVRLSWATPTVALVTNTRKKRIGWSAAGMGYTASGSMLLAGRPAPSDIVFSSAGVPSEALVEMYDRRDLISHLEEIVTAGNDAHWRLRAAFESHVRRALERSHTSVSTELAEYIGSRGELLDEVKLDSLATHMLYGSEDHPGYVDPLIERCLLPNAFLRTEPWKYITDSLSRDSNQLIRRAIGDPHIGPKIRKVAATLGTQDPRVVVDHYKEMFPKDRLSLERATAALSVEPDPMAAWTYLVSGVSDPVVDAPSELLR